MIRINVKEKEKPVEFFINIDQWFPTYFIPWTFLKTALLKDWLYSVFF